MWDFEMGRVLGLMRRTMPFLIFRFLVYVSITLVYIIVTGGGAGIGWVAGKVGGDPAAGATWGGLIGVGLVSTVLYFAREYLLYLVKAGHIAVLVELLDGKELPGGKGQIDHAQAQVKSNFAESSVLFGIDQLIKGVLKTFNRMFLTLSNFIPIPGVQGVVKFLNSVVAMSLTYVDEVILAYHFRNGRENAWDSSREALILYAQNYKNLLKNAVFLTLFIWVLTLLVFIIVLAPVAGLVSVFPALAGFWTFAFAALFAWGIKAALIDPIAMTALMQVFFKASEGQQPDPEWDKRLSDMSGKFRELKSKASESLRPTKKSGLPPQSPPPAPPGA